MLFCQQKEDLYCSLLQEFEAASRENTKALNRYFEEKDWKNYVILVHTVKSSSRTIGADELFLLPSSLHEILAVPNHGQFTFQELLDMVTEINGAVVAPQDILSDNVYHFDARTAKLVHCR